MSNKIHIRLGYKNYQIQSPDEEFAALMNQHFASLNQEDGQISALNLLQNYIQLAYDLRRTKKELAKLREEQHTILEKLNTIE